MREVPNFQTRPLWMEVSASRLRANWNAVRKAAGVSIDVIAIVKADAYGHGSRECAPVFAQAGARWLGVTSVEEGIAVRQALGVLPRDHEPRILIMCGVWQREARFCITHQLTPVVWEPYQLAMLEEEARRQRLLPRDLAVHLEIDTGMSRQGAMPGAALDKLLAHFTPKSMLRLEGVMTHLASAEDTAGMQNAAQIEVFRDAVKQCAKARPEIIHIGNTSSVDGNVVQPWLPQLAKSIGAKAMTRAGLALYGYELPLTAGSSLVLTQPAMEWKTRIVSMRSVATGTSIGYSATFTAPEPMRLALLPVGYADGFRRELSSRGSVLIRNRRAPIVGRVSMDLTVVDVTHIPSAEVGDEVLLIGTRGSEHIDANDHATIAETIPYEILCGISDRVPRILVD
ncbi:MAG: alanine racemase [Acidobacteria bacterium]|nr:alanine racemase [Acidobacteriota bacterium]